MGLVLLIKEINEDDKDREMVGDYLSSLLFNEIK
jgi:hypothetical protein